MKTIPQFLFFLLITFPAFSQNWKLISSDRILNFGSNSNDPAVAKSILVTEAGSIGADSFFRVGPRDLAYLDWYPYVTQVGNLLADSIVQKGNGLYEFHCTEPSETGFSDLIKAPFYIQSLAQPGESWIFQDSVEAQVISIEAQNIWGVADSVKTIALSDGGVILLSKAFGVLQFRDYLLSGLQGTGTGTQLPDNLDWYDWAPGEVFQYHTFWSNHYDLSSNTWSKITVQAKTLTPSTISYTVHRLTKKESSYSFNPPNTTYEDVVETLFFDIPGEVDYPGYSMTNYCTYRSCNYSMSGPMLTKAIGQVRPPCSYSPESTATYKAGLGRTQYYFNYNSVSGGSQTDEQLMGYQKLGQTQQGTIYPNSFYNVATDVSGPKTEQGPWVFPNPARDRATVQTAPGNPISLIVLYDATGRHLRDFQANTSNFDVPIAGLPAGVYLLKIQSGDHAWTRKLVVEGH